MSMSKRATLLTAPTVSPAREPRDEPLDERCLAAVGPTDDAHDRRPRARRGVSGLRAARRRASSQSSGVLTLKNGRAERNGTSATRTCGKRSRMLCAPAASRRSMCGRQPGPYTACSGSRWPPTTGSATSTSAKGVDDPFDGRPVGERRRPRPGRRPARRSESATVARPASGEPGTSSGDDLDIGGQAAGAWPASRTESATVGKRSRRKAHVALQQRRPGEAQTALVAPHASRLAAGEHHADGTGRASVRPPAPRCRSVAHLRAGAPRSASDDYALDTPAATVA